MWKGSSLQPSPLLRYSRRLGARRTPHLGYPAQLQSVMRECILVHGHPLRGFDSVLRSGVLVTTTPNACVSWLSNCISCITTLEILGGTDAHIPSGYVQPPRYDYYRRVRIDWGHWPSRRFGVCDSEVSAKNEGIEWVAGYPSPAI